MCHLTEADRNRVPENTTDMQQSGCGDDCSKVTSLELVSNVTTTEVTEQASEDVANESFHRYKPTYQHIFIYIHECIYSRFGEVMYCENCASTEHLRKECKLPYKIILCQDQDSFE